MDLRVKPGLIQLPIFWCPECQCMLMGNVDPDKHNESHKGHQDGGLDEKTSEGHSETCSGNKEGKKSQEVQQGRNETVSGVLNNNETVSRAVNDGLPVRSEPLTAGDNCGIRNGLKIAVESRPSRGLARREDGQVNERAVTSGSFVAGKGTSPRVISATNFENGNTRDATTSISGMGLSQGTVNMASTMEGVLPAATASTIDLTEIIYYDCKLCDQEFRQLHVLIGHLESAHKIGPAQASAVAMELQKSEDDNDEDGPPLLTYVGGGNLDHGVRTVNVKQLLDIVVGKRIERIGQKPKTGDSNDCKRRRMSPSVEILRVFQPETAEGPNQGSTSQIDKLPLRKFGKETGSPNVVAMDMEVNGINYRGRSSAVRSSERMQPPYNGSDMIFSCKWCSRSFDRNCNLTDHIRRKHPEQKIVGCRKCNFKTAESLLEKHMSNRHEIMQDQRTMASASKAVLTPQPQAHSSRRVISLSHNYAGCGGGEIYGAQSSSITTRSYTATADGQPLKSGVRTTHPLKKDAHVMNRQQHLNHVSELAAGRASVGNTRMRISTRKDHKHRCNECSATFRRPCNLEDHKAMHRGEGPYTCPGCNRQDWCRYTLNTHMKNAHGMINVRAKRVAIMETSDL